MSVPTTVEAAARAAADEGFTLSCEPGVGRLLSVLAAAVPPDGSILELGTGAGVGVAWITAGLAGRTDVRVVSVELDAEVAALAEKNEWPDFVHLGVGDALEVLHRGDRWDLIFADAQGGKWDGLDDTIKALKPAGVLLVDDMTPPSYMNEQHRDKTIEVRERLLADDRLVVVEIAWSTGIILCTRRP
jgi:demethylmenaquinone methyltransferase/2-methoxy-6-polyprenyl-1,4-benzoquinol methylase